MKKLMTLVMALMMLMLAACGSADTNETNETTTEAVVETTEAEAGFKNDVAVADIRNAVAAAYGENYLASMALDADMLEMSFGITADMYDEFAADMPMMSVHVDTLVIVKAKAGQADAVKTALDNYRTAQVENTMQYPMNVAKIQASEVVVYGDYVCFIMLGVVDDTIEEDAARLAAFQEQNKIAKTAIEGMLTK